jgi:xanthine dehydrogenase accessory factor
MRSEVFEALRDELQADAPVALATVLEAGIDVGAAGTGPPETRPQETAGLVAPGTVPGATLLVRATGSRLGSLGHPGLDDAVTRDALGQIDAGATAMRRYGTRGESGQQEVTVFIQAFAPPPQMLIFGAVDFAGALARVAKVLGFRVTVCDARAVFATPERFPSADRVVVDWPERHLKAVGAQLGRRDAVCVLTHDPKFDVPAIQAALQTGVGYIGAMGSRRTTTEREKRLRDIGVDDAGISRLRAPIGLDIGARTPEETAVSICAEIISLRALAPTGSSLSQTDGPIHHQLLPTEGRP